jgi:hypothetical protein
VIDPATILTVVGAELAFAAVILLLAALFIRSYRGPSWTFVILLALIAAAIALTKRGKRP